MKTTNPRSWRLEVVLALLALVPMVRSASIWTSLPDTVPVHWNMAGEPDRFGGRWELVLIASLVALLPYVILLVAPMLDPRRGNLLRSRRGYIASRVVLGLAMCAIALLILESARGTAPGLNRALYPLLFLMLAALGNFLPTLRSNYFVGIRTPWSIDNEENWRATHRSGARIYFWGGLVGALIIPFIQDPKLQFIFFMSAFLLIALAPAVQSYLFYRRSHLHAK